MYTKPSQLFIDLLKVKPVDLKSDKTTLTEAVEHCKKVLTILDKAKNVQFEQDDDVELMSAILKAIGCVKNNQINKKFVNNKLSLQDSLLEKDDITFAISVFDQLIDVKKNALVLGFKMMTRNGENSWINQWLSVQNSNKEIENEK